MNKKRLVCDREYCEGKTVTVLQLNEFHIPMIEHQEEKTSFDEALSLVQHWNRQYQGVYHYSNLRWIK